MIQGGCPDGTGMGGPGYCIKASSSQRHPQRPAPHPWCAEHGPCAGYGLCRQPVLHHARDGDFLDGQYAAFGKVTEGMDVVDRIASVKTNFSDKPKEDQRMKKVTVETFGVDYPEPEKL